LGATLIKLAEKCIVDNDLRVSGIWIYPVKSLGGIALTSSRVFPKGLEFDRRYMLVDAEGNAMTQRKFPKMALFKTSISTDISIAFENDLLHIPLAPSSFSRYVNANVWDDVVHAAEPDHSYSEWFSRRLEVECKLLYFPEASLRPVDPDYQINNEQVSLADAYPLLMIGEQSLAELNSRLTSAVPMDRFRPNIIFSGGAPFIEDTWNRFNIGDNQFAAVKPCARCIMPTIDQQTAIKSAEPIRTLATYRTRNNKVLFGQNVLVISADHVNVGDRITALSYHPEPMAR
jgi:uncharacterized protein